VPIVQSISKEEGADRAAAKFVDLQDGVDRPESRLNKIEEPINGRQNRILTRLSTILEGDDESSAFFVTTNHFYTIK